LYDADPASGVYQKGHYGVSLLAFAPVGHLLVARGNLALALVSAGVVVAFATLPDVDHRIPGIAHRGPTHTLAFALLVGACFAGAASLVADGLSGVAPVPVSLPAYAGFLGVLTVVSHLCADALTPAGVRPFWPLSRRHYSLALARADNRLANHALLFVGVSASTLAYLTA
jgi:inner membrane protein